MTTTLAREPVVMDQSFGSTLTPKRASMHATLLATVGFAFTAVISPVALARADTITRPVDSEASQTAAQRPAAKTSREQVKDLHARSSLTWDQLGKIFGVSRRAVHHWASGGKMNSTNEERLRSLTDFIDDQGDQAPDQIRARLFERDTTGRSFIDYLRVEFAPNRDGDVSGSPLRPDQLIGALHDDVT